MNSLFLKAPTPNTVGCARVYCAVPALEEIRNAPISPKLGDLRVIESLLRHGAYCVLRQPISRSNSLRPLAKGREKHYYSSKILREPRGGQILAITSARKCAHRPHEHSVLWKLPPPTDKLPNMDKYRMPFHS